MTKHGAPDFYQYRPTSVSHPVADLAELAARLGSPLTYDRRGDVLWYDEFEHGLIHVDPYTSGAGASVAVETTTALTGGQSVALTAGSDVNKAARITKRYHPSDPSSLGVEISWASLPNDVYIQLNLAYFPRGTFYYGNLRYDDANTLLEFRQSDGTWTTLVDGLRLYDHPQAYHTLKLALDFDAGTYLRALFNEFAFDLSAYSARSSSSIAGPYAYAQFLLTDTAATNPTIYADRLILTQNEP